MNYGYDIDAKKRPKKVAYDMNRGPLQKVTSYALDFDENLDGHQLKQFTFKKKGWHGDGQPLYNRNRYKDDYKGHYKGYAKRYKDHFDTLQTYPKIGLNKATANRHYRKVKNFKQGRELYQMNRDFDRTTEQVKPVVRVDKVPETKSKFNSENGEINSKIHTGRDRVAMHDIGQLMGGYYYAD